MAPITCRGYRDRIGQEVDVKQFIDNNELIYHKFRPDPVILSALCDNLVKTARQK